MDLRRLRTFVAIAELSTVSKAALRLRISQSALSRQISDLEKEFGFNLFDRIGRRLVLTAVGEHLLGDCRSILAQVGSLGERVELLRRGDSGVLKVAASPQMIESVLSRFLPRYGECCPKVHVTLHEGLGHEQTAMLEHGEVGL
jgi:LysR family transcriptional regulator, nitrogen assimilation regulatory protein